MKICHVVTAFQWSDSKIGIVPWLTEYLVKLKEKGVEVTVFAPSYKGLGDQTVLGLEVKRYRYFFSRWENLTHEEAAPIRLKRKPLYIFPAIFLVISSCINIVRLCRKRKFDIIDVHWPFPLGIAGYLGAKACGGKLVLKFYSAELVFALKGPFFFKGLLKSIIRKADLIVAISSYTKNLLYDFYSEIKVEIIPPGFSVARRVSKPTERDYKKILFVGRLVERKGVEYLIRAMPLVAGQLKVELDIVGDGDLRAKLEVLTDNLKLRDKVNFAGRVKDELLKEYYRDCDLFVLPAIVDSKGDTEGLGMVLVEALSYGKPVIASAVGGIVDIVKDQKTGLLVPEKDEKALAQAIIAVLKNPSWAEKLASAGYQHIKKYFGWDEIASKTLTLYEGICRE
ncbi:MAG: glycosyltransferase family 4 protein [candidate division Zixibacteria bacterium]|nr:glycosyltransferase family 4 protein [candidate division Zixibacteria bacterium]